MAFTKAGLWGPQAIIDSSGHPQPGATATLYLPDEVTLASLWTTSAKSVAVANPTQADIHANLHFYADPGQYRLRVNVGTVVTWLDVEVPIDPGEAAQDQDVVAAQAAAEAYADGIVAAGLATKQPLDSDLTAIAALSTTAFGRGLLILADAAAGRAAFGAVIGTDVQAHDSDLDAIAALATTAFGRALLVLADAAALRTAAGLGSAATHASTDFDAAGTAAAAVAAVVAGAPGALDTLNELATALADDANFATTITNALAGKQQAVARTAVKTTNYSAAAGDLVPVDTTSGAVTVTLPNAPTDKSTIAVKHIIQGGTNVVTIACAGADVFNRAGGGTTATLPYANQAMLLEYTAAGAIWSVIADDLPLSQLDLRFAPITGIPESAVTSLATDLAAKAPILIPTAVKTGNYTAAVGDYVLADTSGGIFTVTLPTAPADKTSIAVDLVASGNTLTIARGGADVFQKAGGPTSLTMNTANRVLVLQYQSSIAVWHVQDHLPAVITTKGDLLTYSTERARLAVGADGALLGADSTQATGLKWIPSGTYATKFAVHVSDYGALDGAASSGAAFQAAANALPSVGGRIIVPQGDFKDISIEVAAQKCIEIWCPGRSATRLTASPNAPLFLLTGTFSGAGQLQSGSAHFSVCGASLLGNGIASMLDATDPSLVFNEGRITVDDCYVSGWGAVAVKIGESIYYVDVRRSYFKANAGHVYAGKNADILLDDDTFLSTLGVAQVQIVGPNFRIENSGFFRGSLATGTAPDILFDLKDSTSGTGVVAFNKFGPESEIAGRYKMQVKSSTDATAVCPAVKVVANQILGAAGQTAASIENPIDAWIFDANTWDSFATIFNDVAVTPNATAGRSKFTESNVITMAASSASPATALFANGGRQFDVIRGGGTTKSFDVGGEPRRVETPTLSNRLTYSEDFNVQWSKAGVTTTTGVTDPWGTTRATTLTRAGSVGSENVHKSADVATWAMKDGGGAAAVASNGRLFFSVYAQAGTLSTMVLALRDETAGVTTLSKVTNVSAAWRRYHAVFNGLDPSHTFTAYLFPGSTATLAGTINVVGAQVSDFDSDYLVTSGTVNNDTTHGARFERLIISSGTPAAPSDVANKAYVDAAVVGTPTDPLQIGYPQTLDGRYRTEAAAYTAAGQSRWGIVDGGGSISSVVLRVSNQSGNIDVGVYDKSGTGRSAVPGSKLASSGSTACPAIGEATVALGSTVPTAHRKHFLALAIDNTSATIAIANHGGGSETSKGLTATQNVFPLPSTGASASNGASTTPWLVGA